MVSPMRPSMSSMRPAASARRRHFCAGQADTLAIVSIRMWAGGKRASGRYGNPNCYVYAVSEDLRQKHAPQTPTAEHAASDQEAHETAVLMISLFAFVALVILFFLVPFTQQMREEKPA